MFEGVDAYPLSWPVGWARTKRLERTNSAFAKHSLAEARDFTLDQLRMSKGQMPIISTNVVLRNDHLPRSGQRNPDDPGVAIYFTIGGKPRVMACDKWITMIDNLWAIGLTIESIRLQRHWGVGSLEQVFKGFAFLEPPRPPRIWWGDILGVTYDATRETARTAYLLLVKQAHPDAGGSQDAFLKVQQAWEQACKERGWS